MMRILILTTLLFSNAYAQGYEEVPAIKTPATFHLKGNVEHIYTIQYSIKLQDRVLNDSTKYTDTILTKNTERNLTFNETGYLETQKLDSFDEKGKTEISRETRYYYSDNRLSGITHIEDGKQKDSTSILYDRHGDIDEQVFFDSKGRKQKSIEYFYRHEHVFNIKVRDDEGLLLNFIRFEYDTNGRLREQEIKGNTMQYLSSIKYTYDTLDDGNIQENRYEYEGAYKCVGMKGRLFDPEGYLVERTITDTNKRVVEYTTMEYNNHGLLSKELSFTKVKTDNSFTYTYDDAGNWKIKKVFESGTPVAKTHRVIDFFKEETGEE